MQISSCGEWLTFALNPPAAVLQLAHCLTDDLSCIMKTGEDKEFAPGSWLRGTPGSSANL